MNRFLNPPHSPSGPSKNPFLENMDYINQEEPYNPFDEEVQRAVKSARKTMQMTSDQEAKALTRSLAAAGKSIASQKPLWGEGKFASFLRQLANSAPDAVLAHADSEDKFQGQNFALADYAAKNRKEIQKQLAKYQMQLQKQAEDRALKREMEEIRLADRAEARALQEKYRDILLNFKEQDSKRQEERDLTSQKHHLQNRLDRLGRSLIPGTELADSAINAVTGFFGGSGDYNGKKARIKEAEEELKALQKKSSSSPKDTDLKRLGVSQGFIDMLPDEFTMVGTDGLAVPVKKGELAAAIAYGLRFPNGE